MAAAVLAAALAFTPAANTATIDAAVIPQAQQAFAACVSHRESRDNYRSHRNEAGSTASGRWQFLDRQWRVNGGLPWMVAARLRQFGMSRADASSIRKQLAATPIWKWAPAYQDAAFVAVLNARGPWSGWRHWHLAGSRCNQLVPAGAR